MSALVPELRTRWQAARLYLVSDVRAQGLLTRSKLSNTVTAVFAVVIAIAVHRAAVAELTAPGGPRQLMLAGASVATVCLLIGNGIAAGALSRTTGRGHERAMAGFPVSSRLVMAFTALICLARGALFSLFFLTPVAIAGAAHAEHWVRAVAALMALIVLPVLPAVAAGMIVRRATPGAAMALFLLAVCVFVTARMFAAERFGGPAAAALDVLAIPAKALLALADPVELLGLVAVWLTVAAVALTRKSARRSTTDDTAGWPAYPGRHLLRMVLRHRASPTAVLSAAAGARLPGSVFLAVSVVVSVLALLNGNAMADLSVPAGGVGTGPLMVIVAAAVMSALTYLAALTYARATLAPPEEARSLAGMPVSGGTLAASACVPVMLAGSLSGVLPVVLFAVAGDEHLGTGVLLGQAALLWLGACAAVTPLAVGAVSKPVSRLPPWAAQVFVAFAVGARVAVVAVVAVSGSVLAALLAAVVLDAVTAALGLARLSRRYTGGIA